MKLKLWANYVIAYLLWFILLGLGFLFGIIGQNAFDAFLGTQTARNTTFQFGKTMIFLDRVFVFVVWLVWLVMMVLSEESLRRSARSGVLLKSFARFAGPLLILLFLADGYLLYVAGFSSAGWLRWTILAGELVLGILLTVFSQPFRRIKLSQPSQL